MNVIIRLSAKEEQKAIPILLRHSAGAVLPDRTYVISEDAAAALADAGVNFTQLSRATPSPQPKESASGERI